MKLVRTPLRVSFFGGGTDYPEYFRKHGGAVLASAIDKFSYITASPFLSKLFDYSVRVSYRKVELVKSVEEIEHRVFRECLKKTGILKDIELHNVADLPAFTGLGSSSTFTVGLLHALHAFRGEDVSPIELAYEAIHVEREVLHENVGCQDQTMAAVGGLSVVEFRDVDNISVHPLRLPAARLKELESHLFLVFTRITRRAHDLAATQIKRVPDNLDVLKKMRHMVVQGADILSGTGSLEAFGRLLHESWQLKRSLAADISNSQIDDMYKVALDHGAWGGKLLGAGGGGFLLVLAPPECHAKLHAAFAQYEIIEIQLDAPGSQVILQ